MMSKGRDASEFFSDVVKNVVAFCSCSAYLRGASRSLDSVRTASKSKKKPPTTSSPGDDARRWREGAAAPRDAEIIREHFQCVFGPRSLEPFEQRRRVLPDFSSISEGLFHVFEVYFGHYRL